MDGWYLAQTLSELHAPADSSTGCVASGSDRFESCSDQQATATLERARQRVAEQDYQAALAEMAEHQGVDLRFVDHCVGEFREEVDGKKVYNLADAYAHADFITYPSIYEGFGNALIEAFPCSPG